MKDWSRDIIRGEVTTMLSREEFVAKYFPQWVEPYQLTQPLSGFRLNKHGRPTMATGSHRRAQQTKRDKKIDAEYQEFFCAMQYEL